MDDLKFHAEAEEIRKHLFTAPLAGQTMAMILMMRLGQEFGKDLLHELKLIREQITLVARK